MAVREMLLQLVKQGFSVGIVGATIFDSPQGTTRVGKELDEASTSEGDVFLVKDGPLTHFLAKTKSMVRNEMTAKESATWYSLFVKALDDIAPDIVYFYGGSPLDYLIPIEAKKRGIAAVAYLANGTYSGTRWCEDVDLILTDSQATASMYKEKLGIHPHPIGAFIDPAPVIANKHDAKNVLLVNPSLEKGAGIFVRLAMLLEKRRPDITFEVVESRGNWHELVEDISAKSGDPRTELSNVVVTPNTSDMTAVYGRARILIALSLCWESLGRVAAEAMMNGIPAITSTSGGLPEATGSGGFTIKLPAEFHEKPYTKIPNDDLLNQIVLVIERFYDDAEFYNDFAKKAREQGKNHKLEVSTQKLVNELLTLLGDSQSNKGNLKRANSDTRKSASAPLELHQHEKLKLTGHQGLTNGRHGYYFYNSLDSYIGKSLELYGEYCEHEFQLLKQFLGEGDTFWDVGANFGGLTIPLAQHVGPRGNGIAFEPQPFVFHALSGSVAANNFSHIRCLPFALSNSNSMVTIPEVNYSKAGNYGRVSIQSKDSSSEGHRVQAFRGDHLDFLPMPQLIKIDVEGMEESVVAGLENIISSEQPIIYAENDRVELSQSLIELLWSYGYILHWHITPYFNEKNFNSISRNLWPRISSFNMLCIPSGKVDKFEVDLPKITDSKIHPLAR